MDYAGSTENRTWVENEVIETDVEQSLKIRNIYFELDMLLKVSKTTAARILI